MKKLTTAFFLGFVVIFLGFQAPVSAQNLNLEKSNFAPGEQITVHFTAPNYFPDNAWIGIIPSQVPHGSENQNDKYDLAYQYLKKRPYGSLVFKAPAQPGSYDIRMHDTDNNGKEVASVSFNVGPEAGAPAGQSPLRLDKASFAPGEKITVHFTTPAVFPPDAWIGIIPSQAPHGSESENDKYDLAYQYMEGRAAGSLVFPAPAQPGSYDIRMHDTDNNGREVASITFTVGGAAAAPQSQSPLRLDKTSFSPGEQIVVYFTAPGNFANNAWIGIIPSNVSHGSESRNDKFDLSYQYLKGRTAGSLAFRAPAQPGSYDFRMHNTDNNGKEIASVTFGVR